MNCKNCGGPLVKCWRYCPVKIIAALIFCCWTVAASAQVYRLESVSHRGQSVIRGTGTAVCIGQAVETGLFLTAKHNLRSVERFAVQGDRGTSEGYRVALHPTEDLAAFCARGQFKAMPMTADAIPAGAPVQVCGFGPAAHGVPDQFCFAASMHGRILTGKSHVIPGDSGGAAYVGLGDRNVLVGIVTEYYGDEPSTDRNDGKSRETGMVLVSQIAEWLPTQYSNCPQCIPLTQPRSLPDRGRIQYRGTPPVVNVPQPRLPPASQSQPPQVVIAPCQDDLRRLVAEYMAKNPPPAGRDGERGPAGQNGRDAEVNYAAIVEAVVSELPPPKQGPPGPPGPAGPQGLVGVPDNKDIRNWLIGAMSDQETRNQLSVLLADLVSSDPRVDALIQRLEALEAASAVSAPPGDLQAIVSRLQALEGRKHSQRVLLVDGSNQTVIDDETYTDEPIVLDVRKFIRDSK